MRPAQAPLRELPRRMIVAEADGRDWPQLYSHYLDAICRGDQTWILEAAANLQAWDMTFTDPLRMEDWELLGANWFVAPPAERDRLRFEMTRLRLLRAGRSSEPIRLLVEEYPREASPDIYARRDVQPEKECPQGAYYQRQAPRRRAEEARNRLQMTDPLTAHD